MDFHLRAPEEFLYDVLAVVKQLRIPTYFLFFLVLIEDQKNLEPSKEELKNLSY